MRYISSSAAITSWSSVSPSMRAFTVGYALSAMHDAFTKKGMKEGRTPCSFSTRSLSRSRSALTALMSISLKVVSNAAVCWAWWAVLFLSYTTGRALLPERLAELDQLLPMLPKRAYRARLREVTPAQGEQRGRVGFVSGCVMPIFFSHVNDATVQLMAANGFVDPPFHAPDITAGTVFAVAIQTDGKIVVDPSNQYNLGPNGEIERLAVAHEDPEKVLWAHELQERYPPDRDAPRGVAQVLRSGEPEFLPEIESTELRIASRSFLRPVTNCWRLTTRSDSC